jgi:hypothetical protein
MMNSSRYIEPGPKLLQITYRGRSLGALEVLIFGLDNDLACR